MKMNLALLKRATYSFLKSDMQGPEHECGQSPGPIDNGYDQERKPSHSRSLGYEQSLKSTSL